MKKLTLTLFISFIFITVIKAQNVGINATGAAPNTSAMLDVAATNKGVSFPNVSLVSETDATTIASPMTGLMIYNTNTAMPCGAGLYFNNGTAGAPVWACFSKTVKQYHAYDTGGRTGVTSTALTLQPGCVINLTVPTGQIADVKIDAVLGGLNVSTAAGAYSVFDVAVGLDGSFLALGGYNRTSAVNPSGTNTNSFNICTLSTWATGLTAGAHTIQLFSARNAGTSAVTLGGNCSSAVNCGEIHAIVSYR